MSLLPRGSIVAASLLVFALWLTVNRGNAAEVRAWTDVAGRKTEAKFVRVFNGEVILEKDGRALKVPLARLSAADQNYIRELTSAGASPVDPASKAGANREAASAAAAPTNADDDSAANQESDAKAAAADLRRMRDWRDTAGNVIKARFERLFGQRVVLTVGTRLRTVEFSRLSAADQEFLRQKFTALGKAAQVPAAIASSNAAGGDEAQVARDAKPLEGAQTAVAGSPPVGIGAGAGFAPPTLPNFGDMAGRMRQHQEQIRATQDRLRAQVQQMHDDMRAARERPPGAALPSSPIAESGPPSSPLSGSAISSPAAALPTPPTIDVPAAPAGDPFAIPNSVDRPAGVPPRSAFDRTRVAPTAGNQPADPFAQAPSIEPQYEAVIVCGACNKAQKPGFKAGQRCQHCGRTIDEITDESGEVVERSSKSTRRNVKFWVWAVIAGISVIGGLIAKLKGT